MREQCCSVKTSRSEGKHFANTHTLQMLVISILFTNPHIKVLQFPCLLQKTRPSWLFIWCSCFNFYYFWAKQYTQVVQKAEVIRKHHSERCSYLSKFQPLLLVLSCELTELLKIYVGEDIHTFQNIFSSASPFWTSSAITLYPSPVLCFFLN